MPENSQNRGNIRGIHHRSGNKRRKGTTTVKHQPIILYVNELLCRSCWSPKRWVHVKMITLTLAYAYADPFSLQENIRWFCALRFFKGPLDIEKYSQLNNFNPFLADKKFISSNGFLRAIDRQATFWCIFQRETFFSLFYNALLNVVWWKILRFVINSSVLCKRPFREVAFCWK